MDYLNEQTTLYVYKIESDKPITFQKNSVNVISLADPEEFEVMVLNNAKIPAINTDSESFSNKLFNSKTIVASNELTEHLNTNAFYLFSFEQVQDASNFKDFYIAENKIDNFELADSFNNLNELTLTQLNYYKELQNMQFVIVKNKEQYNKFKSSATNDITLELNHSALINHINFLNNKNEFIKMKSSSQAPFLLFVNPFRVKNNTYALNFWSFENYNLGLFKEILINGNDSKNNEFINQIRDLYTVTQAVKSGFKNFTDQQIKDFRLKYGDITDLKNYSNQYIKNISDKYILSGEFDKYLKWNAYVLASSNYLFSDYCWKSGLNNEYMYYSALALNMSVSDVETSSRIYNYNPNALLPISSKIQNEFLNGNVFNHFGKSIQFPLLNEQLEEIDYSQNPVDFNNKSFNFNYPVYLFATTHEFQKIIDYSSYVPEPPKNSKKTVIVPCFIQETITTSGQPVKPDFQWQAISISATNDIFKKYKVQQGKANDFNSIFEQNEDIKIPLDSNDEQFFARALAFEKRARDFGNISNSEQLSKVKLLSKVGRRDWQRDDNNYINFLKLAGINDYSNTLIAQQVIYDAGNIQWGAWGDAKLYFFEYEFLASDAKNFEQYFNSLNTTVFTQKEQLQRIYTKALSPTVIFLHKESTSAISQINLAGFWLDYIKIPQAITDQTIQLNNQIYTKIIFW
ncbi:hypothetical protein ACNQ2O_00640 [Mycoplasma sp. AA7A]|uniref:hypothetical protein n=1 Tax=Mycoplasma sp. AA7A TaxID=3401665 RepID=UPI003AAA9009